VSVILFVPLVSVDLMSVLSISIPYKLCDDLLSVISVVCAFQWSYCSILFLVLILLALSQLYSFNAKTYGAFLPSPFLSHYDS
jgi:hypothetical protein